VSKIAVVVFNLGGPDSPAAVQPFLFNLFMDPNILRLPLPLRWFLATLISKLRAPKTRALYQRIGGKSVLLAETQAQAQALEQKIGDDDAKVFVLMRYWNPMAADVVSQIKTYGADEIVLLPLYPQFSTTTTGTSVAQFKAEAARQLLTVPIRTLCCYPWDDGFISAVAAKVREGLAKASTAGKPRVLFTAHSLPESIIDAGDPYQWQMEQTATAIVAALGIADLDWALCYQSRVGPVMWIGPTTEAEVKRAGADKVPVVVVPIAFVSEHIETLVELDDTVKAVALTAGVPHYERVAAVGTAAPFIAGLQQLVNIARKQNGTCSMTGKRLCPQKFGNCPMAATG